MMTHNYGQLIQISGKQEITSAVNHLVLFPNHKPSSQKKRTKRLRDIIKYDIFHKSDDSYKWADNIREQQNFPICSSFYLMLIISLRLWWVWHPLYWHCAAELSLLTQEVISLFCPKPTNSKHHLLGQNSFPGEPVPPTGWTAACP